MATVNPNDTKPRVTTEFSTGDFSASTNMGLGGDNPETNQDGFQSSIELDPRTGKVVGAQDKAAAQPEGLEDKNPEETPEAVLKDDQPTEGEGAAAEALPDFDPANEEVRSKYDARFFNEQGKLNLQALTTEFWGNAAKDGTKPGTLNEGTYKYLEEVLGITKDAAQAIEKGLVADQRASNAAFFNKVGGRERWNSALEWGRKNYTPEQVARFNAALQGNDRTAADDAVEALMARYDRVNPRPGQRRGPPRRGAAPERSSVTSAAVGSQVGSQAPFADQASYQKAWSDALAKERSAKSPAERRAAEADIEKVRRDGRASQRFWK